MTFDPMRDQLVKLAQKLRRDDIKLIVGGGYGLILKAEYLRQKQLATRFPDFPDDRSTNDIDAFLNSEIITDAAKIEKLRDALQELNFESVADFFQFAVSIDDKNPDLKVKIDFLAPPVSEEKRKLVKINKPRIRPKKASKIHGYLTEEAVTLEENLISINLTNAANPAEVFLPAPFTFLVLKLFALRDRLEDESKDFGAYHAFDIYRIIAMMTETEWKQAIEMREKFAGEPKVQEARKIVGELFSPEELIGVRRIRQHIRSVEIEVEDNNILDLIKDLNELFPNV